MPFSVDTLSPFGPGSGLFCFYKSGSAPFIVPKYAQIVISSLLCSLAKRFFWAKSVVSACAGSKVSTRCEREAL